MFNKKTLLSLLVIGSFALTACATNDVESDLESTMPAVEEQDETSTDATQEVVDEYMSVTVKPEEAFDTYMAKHPTTKVKKVQLDIESGEYVYSVEGFEGNMEYEVMIDSMDGTITREHTDTDHDMDEMEITRDHVEKVMAIVDEALAEAGEGSKLEEWTIDSDDGKTQLEIEIDRKGFGKEEHIYDIEI